MPLPSVAPVPIEKGCVVRAVAVLSATVMAATLLIATPVVVTDDSASASTRQTCDAAITPTEPAYDAVEDQYAIGSAADLVFLSLNQNSGDPMWRTRDFVQTDDIDLDGCIFTPIGTRTVTNNVITYLGFEGTFDGDGFTISGFYTDDTTSTESLRILGLFGLLGEPDTLSGTVKNVTLLDGEVFSVENALAGLLVGRNWGVVRDSSATGKVTTRAPDGLVPAAGGLVGQSFNQILRSRTDADVESSHNAGGLVGLTGGTITDSYSTGTVSGTNFVGGLSGLLGDGGSIRNSYAAVVITGESEHPGGLVGRNSDPTTVTNSFWNTTINPDSLGSAGGTGKTTDELRSLSTFLDAGWSIASCLATGEDPVWGIDTGGSPFLTSQNSPNLGACATQTPPSPSSRPEAEDPKPETVAPAPVDAMPGGTVVSPDLTAEDGNTVDRDPAGDPDPTGGQSTSDTDTATGNQQDTGAQQKTPEVIPNEQTWNTGWLWAIGLGGLVASVLLAGGIALSRMRS